MTLIPSQSPSNKKALWLASQRADCSYDVGWSLFQDYHLSGFRIIADKSKCLSPPAPRFLSCHPNERPGLLPHT